MVCKKNESIYGIFTRDTDVRNAEKAKTPTKKAFSPINN